MLMTPTARAGDGAGQAPYLEATYRERPANEVAAELSRLAESRTLTAREMADLGMAQMLEGKPALAEQTFSQAMPRTTSDGERGVLHALRAVAYREQARALGEKSPEHQELLQACLRDAKQGMQLAPDNAAVATVALSAAQTVGDELEGRAFGDHLARLQVKGNGADVCDVIITPAVIISVVAIAAVWDMWRRSTSADRVVFMRGLTEISQSLAPAAIALRTGVAP